ncbi:MAG TPA: GNAT family N-acetyltransferase [Cytophagales bacterium]|nr:GNAT family N-acetyltransferase [Cytophagales bacterium]
MYSIPGDRIRLRPLRPSDFPVFLESRADPAVCRYQGFEVFDEEMAHSFLEEQSQMPLAVHGTWVNVAVEDQASGQLVGDVATHILEKNEQLVELGYTIHPARQGQGYATEALRLMLKTLFRAHHIHKAIAEVDIRNPASFRLLERVGFQREAHFRKSFYDPQDQAWFDEYVYGLLASEFTV